MAHEEQSLKVQTGSATDALTESSFASSTSDTSVFPSLKYYTETERLEIKKDFLLEERSKIHQKWASKKRWEEEALKGFLALEEEVANKPPRPSPVPTKWPKLRSEPYVDSDIDSASETTSELDTPIKITRPNSYNDRVEKVHTSISEHSSLTLNNGFTESRDNNIRSLPNWNLNQENSLRALMTNRTTVSSKLPQPTQIRSPMNKAPTVSIESPPISPVQSNQGLEPRLPKPSEHSKQSNYERLQRDHTRNIKSLKAEKDMFERYRSDELAKLEKLRHEIEINSRREKRTLENHRLVTSTMASKKERQEIDLLREKVKELTEKLTKKVSKSNSELNRLKDRIITLSRRNDELQRIVNDLNDKLMGQSEKPKSDATTQELEKTIELLTKQNNLLKKKLEQSTAGSNATLHKDTLLIDSTLHNPAMSPPTQTNSDKSGSQSDKPENNPLDQLSEELNLTKPLNEVRYPDGKYERIYADGTRLILYRNGTTKEHRSNGYVKLRFVNGDTKESFEDGKVVYYYAETKTIHSSLPDKTEVFQFANGQLEKHHVDGTIEVKFPDATVQFIYPNNEEKSIFPDGSKVIQFVDGTKKVYELNSFTDPKAKSSSPLERSPRKGLRTYTMVTMAIFRFCFEC